MVRAVPRRSVLVPPPVVARQQRVERGHEVVVRPGAELDDHDTGGGMGHPDVEQPVAARGSVAEKPLAVGCEVEEAAAGPGPDLEQLGSQGKMERIASRTRPSAPSAGTDSYRSGSVEPSVEAPHCNRPTEVE